MASEFLASSSSSKKMTVEEHSLRVKGLEGLVIVLRSLLRAANLWGDAREALSEHRGALTESEEGVYVSSQHSAASMLFPPSPALGDGSTDDFGSAADHINAVEIFDKKQKLQEDLETGILKFNLSPKKGLQYLCSVGQLEMTPESVALFLKNYQDRLDKAAVGEYLGREREYENGFCLKVLHEYVELMDFTGMAFDLAIRYFLSGFRLPGEAQKIDRLMEKFAERYYIQNRDTFASADMAFILAFSTIMLQTNLHNPAIREDKRMTKEQFIKQNKGISSDGELSDDMLCEIYDRIAAQPIEITQSDKFKQKPKKDDNFAVFQPSTDKRRKEAFNDERKEMVRASEAMFKQKSTRGSVYIRNVNSMSDEAYARPMFDVVWAPILGVLSQILETSDDQVTVDLCLISFQYAIRLACRLEFSTARNTFVNAIAKFTALDSVREIQKKNLDCIKILLELALAEGDYLEESWSQVLQATSQLARLMFANGMRNEDSFGDSSENGNYRGSSRRASTFGSVRQADKQNGGGLFGVEKFTSLFSGPSKAETARIVEEQNSELVSKEVDPVLLDKIYINSQNLSADSVLHFVTCLCQVSMLEISSSSSMNSIRNKSSAAMETTNPRVFSLQKLVEVADYNMGSRPRIAWAKMWTLLAQHFAYIGVHDNHALAMCAIDSLKQLSIKFLQKEELSNFNFQRVFLKPFETIISRSRFPEIKDLVLRCIDIMIRSCAGNIRSGWKSIFAIFEVAAGQDVLEIANIAFDITERLMNQQFQLLIYDFVELMNCLVAFVASQHTALSLKALGHLARCADHLADGSVSPALESAEAHYHHNKVDVHVTPKDAQIDQDASVFRLWWPLLLGLATRVGDSRLTVRLRALETLNQVLRNYGHLFSPQTWSVIFKGVLFPMVDSAKTDLTLQPQSSWPFENPSLTNDRQSWIGTMAASVFDMYLELYQLFREQASAANLLPDVISTIESCICQETESLSRLAVKALKSFVLVLGLTDGGTSFELDSAAANLISTRLSKCLLQNLCVDFGNDVGSLDLLEDAPVGCVELINECPLARRRRSKEDSSPEGRGIAKPVGSIVETAYSTGQIIEVAIFYVVSELLT
jgi:brefeldin A-inhibited guanine nucleotide-exchange protein